MKPLMKLLTPERSASCRGRGGSSRRDGADRAGRPFDLPAARTLRLAQPATPRDLPGRSGRRGPGRLHDRLSPDRIVRQHGADHDLAVRNLHARRRELPPAAALDARGALERARRPAAGTLALAADDLLARREEQEMAERALGRLDVAKRATFVMFEIEALSCQEIAELMNVPVGTVLLAPARRPKRAGEGGRARAQAPRDRRAMKQTPSETPREASEPARWRDRPDATPGAALILRGTRRPRPPAAHDLARLGDVDRGYPPPLAGRVASECPAPGGRRGCGDAGRARRRRLGLARDVTAPHRRRARPAPQPRSLALVPSSPPRRRRLPRSRQRRRLRRRPRRRPRRPYPRHAPRRCDRPAARAVAAPEVDTLTREIALIDAARARRRHDARAIAGGADSHRRDFPDGQLGAEREFLAVEALRRLGRLDEARARASALASRYPWSSYATRAGRLLQTAP